MSGISYGNTTGGVFDAIVKRGFFSERNGSIMRNGVPAGVMDSFNKTVETVEVLKGPASLLYGPQDPCGVINMVTKKPLYDRIHNEIWTGIGNRKYRGIGFDTTGPITDSGFAYRLIFDYSKKDYWRSFGDFENLLIAPTISYKGDDYRINLGYTHSKTTKPYDRGAYILPKATAGYAAGTIFGADKQRFDEKEAYIDAKTDTVDLNFEKNIGEAWLLKAAYALTRSTHKYSDIIVTNPRNLTNADRRYQYFDDFIHRTHAGSVTLNGIVDTGTISHNLLFGVDYKDYYRARSGAWSNTIGKINLLNGIAASGTSWSATSRQNNIIKVKQKTTGGYVQDSINLTNDLILSLGLRYEYFDSLGKRSVTGKPVTDQTDKALTYQAGLLYLITPEWSVYTNYTMSFKPQVSTTTGDNITNADPEEGKSIEVGSKFQNDSITATLAGFKIDKKNIGRTITENSQPVGEATSKGVEIDFNGRITSGLSLSASYAYTKTKTEKDSYIGMIGKPLEGTPKHQGSLFANYDFTHLGVKGLRLGGGARYFGSWYTYFYSTATNTATQFKLPYAVVYDAFISYDTKIAGYETNFAFNVKNLTDKLYFTSSSTGTTSNMLPVQMGYARQFMLTASVKF